MRLKHPKMILGAAASVALVVAAVVGVLYVAHLTRALVSTGGGPPAKSARSGIAPAGKWSIVAQNQVFFTDRAPAAFPEPAECEAERRRLIEIYKQQAQDELTQATKSGASDLDQFAHGFLAGLSQKRKVILLAAKCEQSDGSARFAWNLAPPTAAKLIAASLPPASSATPAPPQAIVLAGPPLPAVIKECETYSTTICGAWMLHGDRFDGHWDNGATATLSIEQFKDGEISITRTDTLPNSAGFTAKYTGRYVGDKVEDGAVTWNDMGRSWSGTWKASW